MIVFTVGIIAVNVALLVVNIIKAKLLEWKRRKYRAKRVIEQEEILKAKFRALAKNRPYPEPEFESEEESESESEKEASLEQIDEVSEMSSVEDITPSGMIEEEEKQME
jgi:hypothetical protein